MPSFFVIQGRDRGTRFELEKPVLSIGRDIRNDIRLQDTEISRRHAEIRRTDDGFAVHDLGSSNGTFVNGSAISAHALRSGDQLLLGRTLMLYTGGGASAVFDGEVDIVAASRSEDSRILTTMTESEGSRSLLHSGVTDSESPWLARARSNLQIMYRTALAVSHTLDIDELLDRIMGLFLNGSRQIAGALCSSTTRVARSNRGSEETGMAFRVVRRSPSARRFWIT